MPFQEIAGSWRVESFIFMKKELVKDVKLKIAISLNKLLERNEEFRKTLNDDDFMAKSYAKIVIFAYIRKATVSDTFNAKSAPALKHYF